MLRPPLIFRRITSTSRGRPCFYRPFSIASIHRSDALQSVLEGVYSPLEVTSVLRTGQGFKLRTLAQSTPFTVHGNLMLIDGEYFLWRPKLQFPQPGVLDIAPESWGLLDVIAPKPETLVLGTGDRILFVKSARETLSKIGVQLDIQDSKNAASMFNLLQAEGRSVAAALIAQESIQGI